MRRTWTTDVLVVGAGPAGASTAHRLASAGRDVLLVDRSTFPRAKVCGDGLTPRAVEGLVSLGVWGEVAERAAIVTGLRTHDLAMNVTSTGPLPNPARSAATVGAVVPRFVLDDVVRRAALVAGARFEASCDVRKLDVHASGCCRVEAIVGGDAVEIDARHVVGADGANSRVARLTIGRLPGAVRGVALRQYWHVSVPAAFTICIPLPDDGEDLTGYGWVFPVAGDMANVGVGIVGPGVGGVRRVYEAFIRCLRERVPEWTRATPAGVLQGGALAAGLERGRIGGERVLLVGDAAGAVNPYSGEGISQALEGGAAAATAILEEAQPDRIGDAYWRELEARFPQSTRAVDWLPWLLERGGTFAREFWHVASRSSGVVTRAARRFSLDELPERTDPTDVGSASLDRLEAHLRERRPILARTVAALRPDVVPAVGAGATVLGAVRGLPGAVVDDIGLTVALLGVIVRLGEAIPRERAHDRTMDVERLVDWSIDAAALGVIDLCVAELFAVLARLPQPWSVVVGSAARDVLTAEARQALADGPPTVSISCLREFARSIVVGNGSQSQSPRAVAVA